jgi:N-glycosylase/DNA lyase
MEVINIEKNAAVKQANAFLEEATGIQVLLAEKNKRAADLEAILRKQEETKTICLQSKYFLCYYFICSKYII